MSCFVAHKALPSRFEMIEHYATEEAAKEPVESFLRAWELSTALAFGRRELRYEFECLEVIDRDPPPPGGPQVVLVGTAVLHLTATAPTVHMTRRTYPDLPEGFAASPDVETLWFRYERYREGREPLPGMAYFCLTVLQARARSKRKAARQYRISEKVLVTLGRLSTEIGDEQTARKLLPGRQTRLPTSAEVAWIEATITAIIRRVGEHDYDPAAARPQLTMSDLPQLPTT